MDNLIDNLANNPLVAISILVACLMMMLSGAFYSEKRSERTKILLTIPMTVSLSLLSGFTFYMGVPVMALAFGVAAFILVASYFRSYLTAFERKK